MSTNGKYIYIYIRIIPTHFCLFACMDQRVKVGVENILNFIATYMNQPFQPLGKRYEQLNTLYKYYETKYGSTFSSATTSCTFGNNPFFM